MKVEKFIADRITGTRSHKGSISGPIVKIGIIGISVGVAAMLLTLSIVMGFKKEIVRRITGLTTHIVISSTSLNAGNEPAPIAISEDTLKKIKALPFVKQIQTTAFKNGLLKTETENEGILLKGVGGNYDFSFFKEHLLEGDLPDFTGPETSNDIFVSHALVNKMGLKVGGKILIHFIIQHEVFDSLADTWLIKSEQRSRKLRICGVFKTDFADFDNRLSIVDLRQIQRLSYWDSTYTGNYEIKLHDFKNEEAAVEAIQDELGYNYNVNSVREIYGNIFIWLDKLDINGIIIIVLMIIVATINMITALLILILERTNMVGLVKALGMSNPRVRRIFLLVSLKLTLRGLLWGNIAGIGLCLLQYYFKIVKLDSATYYVDHVAIEINWLYFLGLNAGTFVVCALMLFLPTLIITKLTPLRTLKFD